MMIIIIKQSVTRDRPAAEGAGLFSEGGEESACVEPATHLTNVMSSMDAAPPADASHASSTASDTPLLAVDDWLGTLIMLATVVTACCVLSGMAESSLW
jgi:hypothetical protein